MNNNKISRLYSPTYLLCYAIVFYAIGLFFMPYQDVDRLEKSGFAKQETYTYTDSDGEEHEAETLIELEGIGNVLTYKDVYLSSIPFLVISLILARLIFNDDKADRNELRFWMYTNSVIGVMLIWLTKKSCIVSTILFWAGIVMAHFAEKSMRNRNEHQ